MKIVQWVDRNGIEIYWTLVNRNFFADINILYN